VTLAPTDWFSAGALLISALAFGTVLLRTARIQGGDRQRIAATEDAIARLASTEALSALTLRVGDLEGDVKLVASAIAKVAVIDAKLDALDRLMSRETEEIKRSLRGLEAQRFDRPAISS